MTTSTGREAQTPKAEYKNESDPNGKSAHEPGSKLDAGKAPIYRGLLSYFPRAVEAVALVSAFGADKYTWGGWRTVPDGVNRYSDGLVRHLGKEGAGEVLDPDSGHLHAAHTAWNALARLELMLQDNDRLEAWLETSDAQEMIEYAQGSHYLRGDNYDPKCDEYIDLFGEAYCKDGC